MQFAHGYDLLLRLRLGVGLQIHFPGSLRARDAVEGWMMKSPEYQDRYAQGPWDNINMQGGNPNFGRNLLLTFIFYLVVSVLVGYITNEARPTGSGFSAVFQVAGAVLASCAGAIPGAIFFGKPLRFSMTEFADGVVYGLLTGLSFAYFWPQLDLLLSG